jgi:GNAT superfamily N-acetyltransferase
MTARTSWKPIEVDAAAAGADFWARYHKFRRLRHAERRPGDPITPDHVVEGEMKREDPHELHFRYEIAKGDQMLSWFSAGATRPGAPGYDTNKHLLWVDGSVDRDHRRLGIGRTWIPLILDIMERNGYTTVGMGTEEKSGHAFLKWLGAEPKLTGAENRLELADVDWPMLRRWVDEGPRRSPQTRFESYDGRLPESMLDDYSPQLSGLLNTMPFEELDHGEIVVTPAIMLEWFARMDLSGQVGHWMMTREPDGTISGITDMFYAPYSPTIVHQGFTGVRSDARGRGLGKWLKAAMAIHLHELYPEAEWFTTDNASSNAPMLAINTKMGFRTYRVGTEYQITRDQLAARFRELAKAP